MSLFKKKKLEDFATLVLEETEYELKKLADFMFTGAVLNILFAFYLVEYNVQRSPAILLGLGLFCMACQLILLIHRYKIAQVVKMRPDKTKRRVNRPAKK